MGKTIARITVPKVKRGSGYNPYQTGTGYFEAKEKKRSYRKQQDRREKALEGY